LPGLRAFFELLQRRDLPYILATNNSSKTPQDYVQKLARMDVLSVQAHSIITSGTATLEYLQAQYAPDTRMHVLGGSGLKALIEGAGYPHVEGEGAEVVIVGVDFDLTYDKLRR